MYLVRNISIVLVILGISGCSAKKEFVARNKHHAISSPKSENEPSRLEQHPVIKKSQWTNATTPLDKKSKPNFDTKITAPDKNDKYSIKVEMLNKNNNSFEASENPVMKMEQENRKKPPCSTIPKIYGKKKY